MQKRIYYNQKVLKHAELYLNAYGTLMVYGPPGSGKTYLGLYLAEKYGFDLEVLTGKESLRDEDMMGTFRIVLGEEGRAVPVWVDGPLARAFKKAANGKKVLLLVDEITRIPTRYLNVFIEVLNNYDPDYYVFYNHLTGETLKAPKENLAFFATANVNQVGTNEVPEALLDRFASYLYVSFPSLEEEISILKRWGVSEETAYVFAKFAQVTRRMHEEGALEFPVSTRCLVSLAKAVRKALEGSTAGGFEREVRIGMELLKGQLPYLTGSVTGNVDWEEKAQILLDLYLKVYQEVYEELKRSKTQKSKPEGLTSKTLKEELESISAELPSFEAKSVKEEREEKSEADKKQNSEKKKKNVNVLVI